MNNLKDLYINAKDKRKQTLQEIFNTNFEKTLSVVINNKKFIESGQTIKSLNVRVIETDNGVKITSIQCYLKAERTNTVINR